MKSLLPLYLCLIALLLALANDSPLPVEEAAPPPVRPERIRVLLSAPEKECPEGAPILLNVYDEQADAVIPMDLERYVYLVLCGEMPAAFEPQALRAQAVAARSYALWKSALFGGGGCSKAEGADVCTDSTHCMAYLDEQALRERWGAAYDENKARIERAVRDTAGLVCVYDGEPIQALFHAVAGGQTEDAAAVFKNAVPYLRSVQSSGEEEMEKYEAVQRYDRERLTRLLNDAFPGAKLRASGLEEQLSALSRTQSGRVSRVRIGSGTATGRQFRRALSLNSTNFSIAFSEDAVEIRTIGYGHGVGMSQAGANAMAKQGADFEEILTHYYTGVEILPAEALLEKNAA